MCLHSCEYKGYSAKASSSSGVSRRFLFSSISVIFWMFYNEGILFMCDRVGQERWQGVPPPCLAELCCLFVRVQVVPVQGAELVWREEQSGAAFGFLFDLGALFHFFWQYVPALPVRLLYGL